MSRLAYEFSAGTATSTNTAAALGTRAGFETVLIKADSTNTEAVLLGDATSQPFQMEAGDVLGLSVDSLAIVYHKTASGTAGLQWIITK